MRTRLFFDINFFHLIIQFGFLSKYLFSLSKFKVYKNQLNKILFNVLRSSCLELCVAVFNILKYLRVVMNYHRAIFLVVSFCQPESLERTQIAQPEITEMVSKCLVYIFLMIKALFSLPFEIDDLKTEKVHKLLHLAPPIHPSSSLLGSAFTFIGVFSSKSPVNS